MSATVAFGFLKNVLLGRELSKTDFGLFNLLMTLVGFIYPMALLGQHSSLVRLFSKLNPGDYAWKKFNSKLLSYMGPIAAIVAILSGYFYGFRFDALLFLMVAIVSSMIADCYTYLLRAIGKYEFSILLHRSIRISFPLLFLLMIYLDQVTLTNVLVGFSFLYAMHAVAVISYTNHTTPSGEAPLPKHAFREGLFIMGSDLSLLVVGAVDKLFMGQLLNLDEVGGYFAILALMRLFDLALQAVEYVLMPQANKMGRIHVLRIVTSVALVGGLISTLYLVAGGWLTHWLFSGKYDSSVDLIPYFCVIGALRLLYTVPAAIISGRLDGLALKGLVHLNSIIMFLNIIISFSFILKWQVSGALASVSIIWFLRTCAAFWVLMQNQTDAPIACQPQ